MIKVQADSEEEEIPALQSHSAGFGWGQQLWYEEHSRIFVTVPQAKSLFRVLLLDTMVVEAIEDYIMKSTVAFDFCWGNIIRLLYVT